MNTKGSPQRPEINPNLVARLTGVLYLITIFTGIFGAGFVQGRLVIDGDATATATNILSHETLFRVGFASVLVGTASYVAVTALLYALLKAVGRVISFTAALFSLAGCAIWGVGCVFNLTALSVLKSQQSAATALMFFELNGQTFGVGMVFFGVYCLLIGYLVFRSNFFPRVLGILVICAGAGHLISMFATFLIPLSTRFLFPYIMLPGLIGEVALTLWLLVFGVNATKWKERLA